MGVVEAVHPEASREAEDDAIEAGAQNVEELDAEEIPEGHTGATFLTDPKELAAVSKALADAGRPACAGHRAEGLAPRNHLGGEIVRFSSISGCLRLSSGHIKL